MGVPANFVDWVLWQELKSWKLYYPSGRRGRRRYRFWRWVVTRFFMEEWREAERRSDLTIS